MSNPSNGAQGFDNSEVGRDINGCCGQGCASVILGIILLCAVLILGCMAATTPPGTVITLEAGGYAGGFLLPTSTVNLYVINNLPECYILDGRPFPGTRCVWVDQLTRRRQSGVELIGNLIGLPNGQIISDSILPPVLNPMPGNAPVPSPPAASTDILPIVPKVKSLGVGQ